MALCIYRAVWILPLSDSILRSLCTGSICVQRICVFVCPLIPNLNICPTSPYNIGGSCQTLSIRNCHKLNVFFCQFSFSFTDLWQTKENQKWVGGLWKHGWEKVLLIPHKFAQPPPTQPLEHGNSRCWNTDVQNWYHMRYVILNFLPHFDFSFRISCTLWYFILNFLAYFGF